MKLISIIMNGCKVLYCRHLEKAITNGNNYIWSADSLKGFQKIINELNKNSMNVKWLHQKYNFA